MYMYMYMYIYMSCMHWKGSVLTVRGGSLCCCCVSFCVILWLSMCSAIYKCMYCLLLHFLSFSSLNLATFSLFCYADHFIFVLRSFLQGDVIFFKSFIFQ